MQTWLEQLRESARARFEELGYPTTRQEDWRFTNVAPLARTFAGLRPAPARDYAPGPADLDFERFSLASLKGTELVFVNGRLAPELSSVSGLLPDGVRVTPLSSALRQTPALVREVLGQIAPAQDNAFTALNTASFEDGAFVFIPAGFDIDEPIHLLYLTAPQEQPMAIHPRNVVLLERGSRAHVLESYAGLAEGVSWTNAVTEILLEDGAICNHTKLQQESEQAFHTASVEARLGRDAHFLSLSLSFGARLARNDIGALLDAPGAGCILDGLYLADGAQHVDHHTRIEHAKPHCTSQQTYKGILGGKSGGVFNGKILVRKDAQKTDARQSNRNLLLSEGATINTKPELEIYADDVKCAHGATIGQMDEDSVFYLRSRGLDLQSARSLLVYAFGSEILEKIRFAPLRARLEAQLLAWLGVGRNS